MNSRKRKNECKEANITIINTEVKESRRIEIDFKCKLPDQFILWCSVYVCVSVCV